MSEYTEGILRAINAALAVIGQEAGIRSVSVGDGQVMLPEIAHGAVTGTLQDMDLAVLALQAATRAAPQTAASVSARLKRVGRAYGAGDWADTTVELIDAAGDAAAKIIDASNPEQNITYNTTTTTPAPTEQKDDKTVLFVGGGIVLVLVVVMVMGGKK